MKAQAASSSSSNSRQQGASHSYSPPPRGQARPEPWPTSPPPSQQVPDQSHWRWPNVAWTPGTPEAQRQPLTPPGQRALSPRGSMLQHGPPATPPAAAAAAAVPPAAAVPAAAAPPAAAQASLPSRGPPAPQPCRTQSPTGSLVPLPSTGPPPSTGPLAPPRGTPLGAPWTSQGLPSLPEAPSREESSGAPWWSRISQHPTPLGSGSKAGSQSFMEEQMLQQSRVGHRVMCIGFIAAMLMVSLPVAGGIILLKDPTYRFWAGPSFPLQLLSSALGPLLLLGLALLVLAWRAPAEAHSARTFSSLASGFASLNGLLLVYISLSATAELYVTASTVGGMGCRSSSPVMTQLMDYSVVLYTLRMEPTCFMKESVTMCKGWGANKYTRYLQYLEEEFSCGPLCPEEPAPMIRPTVARTGLLDLTHEKAKLGGRGRERAGTLQPELPFGPGAMVRLSGNETRVREAFKSLPSYAWHDEMAEMLGHDFRVARPERAGIVGLPSPDGSQEGVWYFPAEVMELAAEKMEAPPEPVFHAASLKLFSPGSTSMTCLPIVATRLRVLAYSFGDLIFFQGLFLLVAGLFCAVLTLLRGFDRPGGIGSAGLVPGGKP